MHRRKPVPGHDHPQRFLKGGDFNRSMNETGATPVHMAAAVENGLLLSALLEAGVPAVAVTHSGATALHKAAAAGCLGMCVCSSPPAPTQVLKTA